MYLKLTDSTCHSNKQQLLPRWTAWMYWNAPTGTQKPIKTKHHVKIGVYPNHAIYLHWLKTRGSKRETGYWQISLLQLPVILPGQQLRFFGCKASTVWITTSPSLINSLTQCHGCFRYTVKSNRIFGKKWETGCRPSAWCNNHILLYWSELKRRIEEQSPHSNLSKGQTPFQGKLTIITFGGKNTAQLFSHDESKHCAGWNILWQDDKKQKPQKIISIFNLVTLKLVDHFVKVVYNVCCAVQCFLIVLCWSGSLHFLFCNCMKCETTDENWHSATFGETIFPFLVNDQCNCTLSCW